MTGERGWWAVSQRAAFLYSETHASNGSAERPSDSVRCPKMSQADDLTGKSRISRLDGSRSCVIVGIRQGPRACAAGWGDETTFRMSLIK